MRGVEGQRTVRACAVVPVDAAPESPAGGAGVAAGAAGEPGAGLAPDRQGGGPHGANAESRQGMSGIGRESALAPGEARHVSLADGMDAIRRMVGGQLALTHAEPTGQEDGRD